MGHEEHRQRTSRRNVLGSIATGMTAVAPLLECTPQFAHAATSTTISKAFRAYEVQPDSSEKLNPTLKALTVKFLIDGISLKRFIALIFQFFCHGNTILERIIPI